MAAEKLPTHMPQVRGRCPFCRHEFHFPNPRFTADLAPDPAFLEQPVFLFRCIPTLWALAAHQRFPLKEGLNTLGRHGMLAFPEDPFMSRIHCLLDVQPFLGGFRVVLSDDGTMAPGSRPSSNGTYLNDQRVGQQDKLLLLKDDRLKVGNTELLVQA